MSHLFWKYEIESGEFREKKNENQSKLKGTGLENISSIAANLFIKPSHLYAIVAWKFQV